ARRPCARRPSDRPSTRRSSPSTCRRDAAPATAASPRRAPRRRRAGARRSNATGSWGDLLVCVRSRAGYVRRGLLQGPALAEEDVQRRVAPPGAVLVGELLEPTQVFLADRGALFLISRIAIVDAAAERSRLARRT